MSYHYHTPVISAVMYWAVNYHMAAVNRAAICRAVYYNGTAMIGTVVNRAVNYYGAGSYRCANMGGYGYLCFCAFEGKHGYYGYG